MRDTTIISVCFVCKMETNIRFMPSSRYNTRLVMSKELLGMSISYSHIQSRWDVKSPDRKPLLGGSGGLLSVFSQTRYSQMGSMGQSAQGLNPSPILHLASLSPMLLRIAGQMQHQMIVIRCTSGLNLLNSQDSMRKCAGEHSRSGFARRALETPYAVVR